MAGLSDIEEVEENSYAVERSSHHVSADSVSEAPTKNSKAPSVMVSIDPSLLSMASMVYNEEDSADEVRRKSKLCCGSCCDFVRACLVVDAIYISVLMFINVSNWFFPELLGNSMGERIRINPSEDQVDAQDGGFDDFAYDDMYDDMYNELYDENAMSCYFCTTVIQNVVGMVLALVGAIGAWRFQEYMVLLAGIWFCVDATVFCVFQNWASGLWVLGYAYPHFGLYLALRSGKITRENYYISEQHCCGCECDRGDDDSDSDQDDES